MRNKKSKLKKATCILLLFMMAIGMASNVLGQKSYYEIAVKKGTQTYEVQPYNEKEWAKTVTGWFVGDCNKSGARSKATTRGLYNWSWGMYDVFSQLFLPMIYGPEVSFMVAALVASLDFDREYINDTYDRTFPIWNLFQSKWDFVGGSFNETANNTRYSMAVFQNPEDYGYALNSYNDLISDINRKYLIRFLDLELPRFTPDEFLWELVLNGLILAQPISDYLINLVGALDCSANVRVDGNTLIFRKLGKALLEVDVTFGSQGTLDTFTVKDVYGTVVYKITSTYSGNLAITVSLYLIIPFIGLVAIYYIHKYWKKNKIPNPTPSPKINQ